MPGVDDSERGRWFPYFDALATTSPRRYYPGSDEEKYYYPREVTTE